MAREREVFVAMRVLQDDGATRLELVIVDHVVPRLQRGELLARRGVRPGRQLLVDNWMFVFVQAHLVCCLGSARLLRWTCPCFRIACFVLS